MIRSRLSTCLVLAALCTTPILFNAPETLAAATAMDGKTIKGEVLETMNSGGYTYIQVKAPEGEVWVAMPETKVEKGQQVVCNPGMAMTNFQSKSLNRTFDTIIFSSGLGNGNQAANPHGSGAGMAAAPAAGSATFADAMQAERGAGMGGAPAMGGTPLDSAMAGASGSTSNIVPSKEITVEKAPGKNAYTVGEIFEKGKNLNNKKIAVRGKVVKVSKMIMGKNWLHIQDGTGNPMQNTHDLVVTTMAEPALDSVVIIEGTLHANKDFGAGYKYDVIIEDADIK
ncbi:MAG: DNA-binding protein [Desulfobulbaceae bacterium]|nr:DNA-binding protein [Desulfobulbaceae bacterium]